MSWFRRKPKPAPKPVVHELRLTNLVSAYDIREDDLIRCTCGGWWFSMASAEAHMNKVAEIERINREHKREEDEDVGLVHV